MQGEETESADGLGAIEHVTHEPKQAESSEVENIDDEASDKNRNGTKSLVDVSIDIQSLSFKKVHIDYFPIYQNVPVKLEAVEMLRSTIGRLNARIGIEVIHDSSYEESEVEENDGFAQNDVNTLNYQYDTRLAAKYYYITDVNSFEFMFHFFD